MTTIFYNIIIAPIELIVEIIFQIVFRLIGQREINQGYTLICVSLVISLSTLPLYRKADKIQREAREKQKNMQKWITHIRKTFKGDERFLMLQAYYKLNDYNPLSSLKGALPLFLQIPFFTAAYHFLSHLQVLQGASFGLISDLGKPDSLINIGNFSINLLPILMTTINCISSAIYLKGFAIKDKIQTYGLAVFFLIFLYKSPSGLVVYWTFNNLFSLIKNIFYKLKNPRKIINILSALLGLLLTSIILLSGILNSKKKIIATFLFLFLTFLPLLITLFQKYYGKFLTNKSKKEIKEINNNSIRNFLLSGVFLTILTGILIPSAVISSSPAEFVDLNNYKSPLIYLCNSIYYAIGFFIIWSGIVRFMLPKNSKHYVDLLLWILSGIFLIDYLFFGTHLGTLSPSLIFKDGLVIKTSEKIINLLVIIFLTILLIFIFKYKRIIPLVLSVILLSVSILSVKQINTIQNKMKQMSYIKDMNKTDKTIEPVFTLSKTGENVIVFMLDRTLSGLLPYLFEEKPQLLNQFGGFTYYPNTLSFGGNTAFGSPALFGGYEYTPTEMNKRKNELIADKHNEALLVLPVLFNKNNYEVTVIDPPYAGYTWIPDLSIYDSYPEINKYILAGQIYDKTLLDIEKKQLELNKRNFFCYSIFKSIPLFASQIFYSKGDYFGSEPVFTGQTLCEKISVLQSLPQLTEITNDKKNTCLVIQNSTTHEANLLQLPDYEIKLTVNNSEYKTSADDKINMKEENQKTHYHVNMAALLELGKWFDYLRENDVYDNSRIIIVADHGRDLGHFDYMLNKELDIDVELFNPLLLVKDFGEKNFKTSNEFMTNADVPSIAVEGIIENPVNPFTNKVINNEEKYLHPQIITSSSNWDTSKHNGNTFETSDGQWYSVHDNIFEKNNWELIK